MRRQTERPLADMFHRGTQGRGQRSRHWKVFRISAERRGEGAGLRPARRRFQDSLERPPPAKLCKPSMIDTGRGKTMVELFSPAISVKVCK